MRAIGIRFERFRAEASADLRLADPPIPQHHQLDVRQAFRSRLEVA